MIGLGPLSNASPKCWVPVAALLAAAAAWFKTSAELRLENLVLRQQGGVLRPSAPNRLRLTKADRAFWVCLRSVWSRWDRVLMIVIAGNGAGLTSQRGSTVLDVAHPPRQSWPARHPAGRSEI